MKLIRRPMLLLAAVIAATASAGEIGHYNGGIVNVRDYAMPPTNGVYGAIYNYFYSTDRLNDSSGNEVKSYTYRANRLPGKPSVTLNVETDVDIYVLAPALIYVSDFKLLGARYGALVLPTFADASIGASLSTETGRGGSLDNSHFNVGDMMVQPLWLDWGFRHFDVSVSYSVWVPIGKYQTEITSLPVVGPTRVESTDNIGYGFWTHQIQGSLLWYPWEDRRMAVMSALTYEIHHKKRDFDLTPGQNLTLSWGISQFLPLRKDHTLLLELGPAGYSTWQVTDDDGDDARNGEVHDEVHAAGGQLGVTYLPWLLSINTHYFYEFASKDRFQGSAWGISIAKKF